MFERSMTAEVSQVVFMRSSESSTIDRCDAYSDGYVVRGRHSFYGAINQEYFWVDARACFRFNGASCGVEIVDMNGALMQDMLVKVAIGGLAGAMAECANDPNCGQ
ncbi:MAG: hypothetical protein CMF75_04710 [Maricaulis sp.]|nr:hypothetical protein [Maricaulis sp.]